MDCNRVALCGRISGLDSLRYTPAGIPIVDFKLAHASEQVEAGTRRQVQCEVSCMALEQAAREISQMNAGDALRVEGFLARRSRNSTQLVLHVSTIARL